MADRNAKAPDDPENPREIVELDKDDRWQARLEEARARREIALREKAQQPKKKRLKPWETDPAENEDGASEIDPVIQDKPDDEPDLDFADRFEVMRETSKVVPRAETPAPASSPEPEVTPEPQPEVPPVRPVQTAPPDLTPVPTTLPPPAPKPKPRRDTPVVAPDAPDVIDLAHRYASTLKPPVNVTETFEPVVDDPVPAPQPEPVSAPVATPSRRIVTRQPSSTTGVPLEPYVPMAQARRPFGLGLAVLAFSLIPLSQVAPPLEKGPAVPPTPFFGLPPALGLTTSMVWRPEATSAADWQPTMRIAPFPGFAAFELAPQSPVRAVPDAPREFAQPTVGEASIEFSWAPIGALEAERSPSLLESVTDSVSLQSLPPMQSPRPRPKATAAGPDVLSVAPEENQPNETLAPVEQDVRPSSTVPPARPLTAPAPSAPEADGAVVIPPTPQGTRPTGASQDTISQVLDRRSDEAQARVDPGRPVGTPANPLKVTILVPSASDRSNAERIAEDARARGHDLTRVKEVNLAINEPNVRYFHEGDRAEAARLAEAYGAEVKDFTWFRPRPEPGTTEIWLSGRSNVAVSRPNGAPARPEVAEAPPRTVTVIRRQPTLLERLFTGREGEIEIILPNPNGILSGQGIGEGNGN